MLPYQRKTRASNFTIKEKALLVALVRKYEDIEIKKNDKVGATAKNQAWYNLTQEFNASSGEAPRTQDTLQRCWNNLKKTTRRAVADMKADKYKSGGSLVRTSSLKSIEEQVLGVIGVPKKELSSNHNDDSIDDDDDDSVTIEEESLSLNSFTKDSVGISKTSITLPVVESCASFSDQIHGVSEESRLAEESGKSPVISLKVQDPLSVGQSEEGASTTSENCGNSSNWCEWIPLSSRQPLSSLFQNAENSTQHRERSILDTRRIDVIEMMKQQMREEIEFRREEAQHKRELFEIQKQQELLKLKLLQKALQNANVTISMPGTTIHTVEK